jgi:tRNA (Thr-GGU) A37 N-methylase
MNVTVEKNLIRSDTIDALDGSPVFDIKAASQARNRFPVSASRPGYDHADPALPALINPG